MLALFLCKKLNLCKSYLSIYLNTSEDIQIFSAFKPFINLNHSLLSVLQSQYFLLIKMYGFVGFFNDKK
jgi:hypothetical protein